MTQRYTTYEERVARIAGEYRKLGYNVLVHPSLDQVPKFLGRYTPDLLALRENDNVIVEIKTERTKNDLSDLVPVMKAVEERSDWRFDLVFANPRGRRQVHVPKELMAPGKIVERLQSSELLIKRRDYEGALVIAWTAVEATLRYLAWRADVDVVRKPAMFMVKQLFSLGHLNRGDYELLESSLKKRNDVAHGFIVKGGVLRTARALSALAQRLINQHEIHEIHPAHTTDRPV
jgi:hypothetical protein